MSMFRSRKGWSRANGYEGFPLHKSSNASSTHLLDNSTPLKSLNHILKQFDSGEKRQWPSYLQELTAFFQNPAFSKMLNEKSGKVIDHVTHVFARILNTKLFPDIVEELVLCLAAFSSALGYFCDELFEWIFELYYSSPSEEKKLVLLKSLVKIIENGNSRALSDNMLSLINKVKKALEETTSSDLLLGITDIFLASVNNYSTAFQVHFRDVIDILIGWHIDSSQSPIITQKLSKAFITFNSFWIQDFEFSLILLGHFLEDFEAFFGQLIEDKDKFNLENKICDSENIVLKENDNGLKTFFRLNKMASLVRVYLNVLQSLGNFASPDQNPSMSWDFIVSSLRSILITVNFTIQITVFEPLIISTNECVIYKLNMMFSNEMELLQTIAEPLITYLELVHSSMVNVTDNYILTTLQLMSKFIQKFNGNVPIKFITSILESNSNCQKLRFIPSSNILTTLFELHHTILSLKNVSILESAYRCFLLELKQAFSVILGQEMIIIESKKENETVRHYNKEEALVIINSTFISLTAIIKTKHSIIGMWALKPTFFDLIIEHLNPANDVIASSYPNIQYSMLYILFSHCNRHNHFIASSNLINNTLSNSFQSLSISPNVTFNASIITSQSNGHLSKILTLLTLVLKKKYIRQDIQALCLNWSIEIINNGQAHLNQLISSQEFKNFLRIISLYTFSKDPNSCLCSCQAIQTVLKSVDKFEMIDLLNWYYQACLINISHINPLVKNAYLNLLAILTWNCPMQSTGNFSIFQNKTKYIFLEDIRMTNLCLMKEEPNTSFSAVCFTTIMRFLLDNQSTYDENCLKRLSYSCLELPSYFKILGTKALKGHEFSECSTLIPDIFDYNESVLIFWACWQVIQYCIVNKLRTPLGKAQETFTKIEKTVQAKALEIQTKSQIGKNLNHKELVHTRMLLLLMENLDKLMYNAYGGSAVRLFTTPKPAVSFFRTNKTTCIDWMNRNRRSLMIIGFKSGDPASIWRNGQELLKEMVKRSSFNKFEFIIVLMVQALMELKASDSIVGLYLWTKENLGINYAWIKCAIEETQGKYENALSEYKSYLSQKQNLEASPTLTGDNENGNGGDLILDFINSRILECYLSLGCWEDAFDFYNDFKVAEKSKDFQKIFQTHVDLSYLKNWSFSNDTEQFAESSQNLLSWNISDIYHKGQSDLTLFMQKFSLDNQNLKENIYLIDNVYKFTSSVITCNILCSPSLLSPKVLNVHKIAYNMLCLSTHKDKTFRSNPFTIDFREDIQKMDCSSLVHTLFWIEKFIKVNPSSALNSKVNLNQLYFLGAKIARKQQNLLLSQNLLLKFAQKSNLLNDISLSNRFQDWSKRSQLSNIISDISFSESNLNEIIKLHIEGSKLLHAFGDTKSGINMLLKCVSRSNNYVKSNESFLEIFSKSLITLVKFFQTDKDYLNSISNLEQENLLKLTNNITLEVNCQLLKFDNCESICGKLLHMNVNCSPSLPDSWFALGAWSYCWGHRLTDVEELEKCNESELSECEENSLAFYRLAAKSFFRYLQLNGSENNNIIATLRLLRLIVKHATELRDILEVGLNKTLTRPWKSIILQLFARLSHPEPYVRQSISELLCRIGLDSPHLIVFPAVAGSFTNSNEDLILKEKVIETKSNTFNEEINVLDYDFDEDETEEDEKQDKSMMQNCFHALVETLAHQNPELIAQTKTFVHELRRITILWDELWIGTLLGHMNEMKKQVTALEEEIIKVQKNNILNQEQKENIIQQKSKVFFTRIVYVLEQTHLITSEAPETPHESWFRKTFLSAISNTIKMLKDPADPSKPQQSLTIYQQLLNLLQNKASQWNSVHSQFIMSSISTLLSDMKNTKIPMPGAIGDDFENLTKINKVHRTVTILHTNTKPKKIAFYGSDGKTHTYLLKGHEDLHLDERIMHFLSIVNKMFAKYQEKKQHKFLFRARHYSVTPLGTKSGLIHWVDGGCALYGFYKRWMINRDSAVQSSKSGQKSPQPCNNYYKPSEIFSRELVSKGISNLSRRDWPLSILVEILKKLIKDTPENLISRELWCSSVNAFEYWNLTQTFTQSNAVMCMIGYIIGLGDRHLDNVLVDLSTGEVIHIDYNICFEKGKTLRVPERVPCRLTHNIVNAFSLSGIEGTFRTSCEHVIRVLRKGREILLKLLEAFLYDPLIDWTPGIEEGYTGAVYGGGRLNALKEKFLTKYQMEKEIAQSMLKIRLTETRTNVKNIQEKFKKLLSSINEKLINLINKKDFCVNLELSKTMTNDKHTSVEDMSYLKDTLTLLTFHDEIKSKNVQDCLPFQPITEKIISLKSLFNSHNAFLSEIKQFIRTLIKLEEKELGPENKHEGPVTQYFLIHRKFTENVFNLLKQLELLANQPNIKKNFDLVDSIKSQIDVIQECINPVFETLLQIPEQNDTKNEINFNIFSFQQSNSINALKFQDRANQFQTLTAKKSEKQFGDLAKNIYATSVWKRVKMKLDGKDPDPNKKSTVSEQVDYVIKESINLENLALMYEGWTSWV